MGFWVQPLDAWEVSKMSKNQWKTYTFRQDFNFIIILSRIFRFLSKVIETFSKPSQRFWSKYRKFRSKHLYGVRGQSPEPRELITNLAENNWNLWGCEDLQWRSQGERGKNPPLRNGTNCCRKMMLFPKALFLASTFPKVAKNSIFLLNFYPKFSKFPNNLCFLAKINAEIC